MQGFVAGFLLSLSAHAPMIEIQRAETDEQIAATFDVMHQLRPHLTREGYVPLVREMMASDDFRIAAVVDDGVVRAVAGYRIMRMLYCGRLLYLDDLVTDERVRSRGHGKALIDWLKEEGRREGCAELQLISNVVREGAHRFYFREGFGMIAFHFRARLQGDGER
jgi:GNAT superfamily N-acetyltransferase